MLFAFLLIASMADWVPARWISNDPKSLELVRETPINCLLLERDQWSPEFAEQASKSDIVTLGVVRPGGDPVESALAALSSKLYGIVLEGDFTAADAARVRQRMAASKAPVVEMLPRRALQLQGQREITATYQSVWPGIQVQEDDGKTRAGPTGSPWINTNTGFLIFVRASADGPVWVGNLPPPKRVLKSEDYLFAICDAAAAGARWVVALDADFRARLLRREAQALKDWTRMGLYLRYFEDHKEWRGMHPNSRLTVLQDADSGALLSGSILDMMLTKRSLVRVLPRWKLNDDAIRGATMVLNLEADLLTPEQKAVLTRFTNAGKTLATSPPQFKPPVLHGDEITVDEKEVAVIEDLWHGVNSAVSHAGVGLRMYNVSSMLSNAMADPENKRVILHLVNYSGYPVENITVFFPGSLKSAKMLTPERPPQDIEVFEQRGETTIELDKVGTCTTLVLEEAAEEHNN
jgi:hypothetical protein